jgi:hypothetical protein
MTSLEQNSVEKRKGCAGRGLNSGWEQKDSALLLVGLASDDRFNLAEHLFDQTGLACFNIQT